MGKCCNISDIFMKFHLVYPGKKFAYQLVQKEYLLITDEWMSVKIFTAPYSLDIKLGAYPHTTDIW